MKYIGENAISKLISLIKGDLATKQPTITASGILKGDGTGTVTAADTQEATLVDVPNGLLKGDGTTISAAVAGTDYAAASHNHDSSYLKLTGGTMTGAISFSGSQESETSKLFWKNGAFCLTTGQGNVPPFKLSSNDEEATLSFGPAITETGSSYYSSSISLKGNGLTISAPGGFVKITDVKNPTSDSDAANKSYVDSVAPTPIPNATITSTWNSVTV